MTYPIRISVPGPLSRKHLAAHGRKVVSLCSAVTLTLLLCINPASAQEKTPAAKAADEKAGTDKAVVLDTFVVNSVRASLMSAQDIKANAPGFVDSIVAQDVGKLPDNTVADALQRIAGIQVAHAAGEANTPVIRGLPAIETTLNGYEVFTGTGRGVAFQDIPAEMVAGLDAYKSISPDQIEGGVAGLIDVRLRRPLDFKPGLTTALNVRGMYSSQSRKNSYFVSGLVNNRWKLAHGEFGLLLDVSYQKRQYEDQIFDNWVHYGAGFDVATDATGKAGYFADNFGFQIIPGKRTRPAGQIALQWKTDTGFEFYAETLFTGYRNVHSVDFFIGIPSWGGSRSNVTLYPAGYAGVSIPDPLALNGPGTNALFVKSFTATNTNTIISKQAFSDYTNTVQGAFGVKWVKDNLLFNAEASYNISMVKTRGAILDTIANSPTEVWKLTYNDGSNISAQGSGLDFTNPSNFVASNLFDQWGRAHTKQYALKADALLSLASNFIKSVKFGLRYSDRAVNFHQANPGPAFGPAVAAASIPNLGVVTNNNLFVSNSDMNIRSWWSPDTSFLLNNTDVVRQAGGRPLGKPPVDPASTFIDEEKTLGLYGMANYKATLGSTPLDGSFGVRFANTKQDLGGYQHPLDASGSSINSQWVKTSNSNKSWETLPVINGRLHFSDALQLRFSGTKTLTRPNFGDLNPALALFHSGPTSQIGSGNGGNPKLNPVKSTNYDLALEYYFSKTSQATFSVFDRELQGYVQSFSKLEDVGGTPYNITRPQNTGKGRLKGFEVTYQLFLDYLSIEALKGVGFQLNYTGINGTTENPARPGQQQQITQVAKSNYNVILIYEKGRFSSRLAYTVRGQYIDSYNQPGFQPNTVYVQPTKFLDLSASYAVTQDITITFDATNLLGSKYRDRFGPTAMFNRDVRNYDTTYAVGARFRF